MLTLAQVMIYRIGTYLKNALSKYRVLDQELMTSHLGVAFSKGFDFCNVVQKLSAALNEMKSDGTIDEIMRKYE